MRPRGFIISMPFLATLALAAGAAEAPAKGRVSGQVIDSRTTKGVPGATVVANGETLTTDASGAFALELSPGSLHVDVVADQYRAAAVDVSVQPGAERKLRIELVPRVWLEEQVDVVAAPNAIADRTSVMPVRPSEVLQVAGALENVFRVLPTLPGVAPTDEASSRISVRGGGPDQNLTMMDGVEIHNPYRIWGLVSAFNPETVSGFELSTGAFSARYGDRLSSVLTVENRAGSSTKAITGSAGLSLTDGNVIVEGRLPGHAGSWLVTGRRTWYDAVAGRFTDNDLPSFGDLQGKLFFSLGGGRNLSLFGMTSREKTDMTMDESDVQGSINSRTHNGVGGASLLLPIGRSFSSRTIAAAYENGDDFDLSGRYRNDLERSNGPDEDAFAFDKVIGTYGSTVRDLSLRQELQVMFGRGASFEVGGEMHDLETSLDLRFKDEGANDGGLVRPLDPIHAQRTDRRYGAWAIQRLRLGSRIDLEAGVRYDRSEINERDGFAPRLSAAFLLTNKTRLRAAYGVHTQSPGYEKLAQSDYVLDFSQKGPLSLDNERAKHIVVGLEQTLPGGVTARIEGFHKSFDRLVYGRLETPEETAARVAAYDFPAQLQWSIPRERLVTEEPVSGATGTAHGFDVFVSRAPRPGARVGGWVAYTFTNADRDLYGRTFRFSYEQRHALSVVGSFKLKPRLELSLTGRFASGYPRTPPLGLRVAATADLADGDGDGVREELVPEYDKNGLLVYTVDFGGLDNLSSAHNKAYARLDSRITWTPGFGHGRLRLYVDVINVLARKNGAPTVELDYQPNADRPMIVEKSPEGFPLFPSFGIHYRF